MEIWESVRFFQPETAVSFSIFDFKKIINQSIGL